MMLRCVSSDMQKNLANQEGAAALLPLLLILCCPCSQRIKSWQSAGDLWYDAALYSRSRLYSPSRQRRSTPFSLPEEEGHGRCSTALADGGQLLTPLVGYPNAIYIYIYIYIYTIIYIIYI